MKILISGHTCFLVLSKNICLRTIFNKTTIVIRDNDINDESSIMFHCVNSDFRWQSFITQTIC